MSHRKYIWTLILLVAAGIGVFVVRQADKYGKEEVEGHKNFDPPDLKALVHSEVFELLSLEPAEDPTGNDTPGQFYGWKELGRVRILEKNERQELITALRKGVKESDSTSFKCFVPRHGIHTSSAETTTDLVICFECMQFQFLESGSGRPMITVSRSPQAAFDKVLKKHSVQLAKQSKTSVSSSH